MDNGGCKLYHTKKGSTPFEFRGLLDAVFVCRARHKAGLPLAGFPLPYWAERAYLVGNGVYAQVEQESYEEDEEESTDFGITSPGDSGAFGLIYQELQQRRVTTVRNVYGRQHNSGSRYIDTDADG